LPPRFFIDRNLGSKQLPRALRDAGWDVVTMADHYGELTGQRITDTAWLALAGTQGWPVLMKDKRIRYRALEQEALRANGVKAFGLSRGDLSGEQQVSMFLKFERRIFDACLSSGPFLYVITANTMRRVELS